MEQFLRTELLLGKENLNKIFNAKVTVVGLGAVGFCD
jgi:tRNA A37 threonylcarbamoyladenosine dehydratase